MEKYLLFIHISLKYKSNNSKDVFKKNYIVKLFNLVTKINTRRYICRSKKTIIIDYLKY